MVNALHLFIKLFNASKGLSFLHQPNIESNVIKSFQQIDLWLQTHQSGQGKFLPWLILRKNSMPLMTTLPTLRNAFVKNYDNCCSFNF